MGKVWERKLGRSRADIAGEKKRKTEASAWKKKKEEMRWTGLGKERKKEKS